MTILKVKDTELVREVESNAIINKNRDELNSYLTKRKYLAEQKNQINKLKNEISDIKSDVTDIKNLLTKLLEKG